MTNFSELEFHINDRTPETIPAKELLKCLSVLVAGLGEDESVHFKEVRDGCACPVLNVKADVISKVYDNCCKPENINKLNKKLADYNTDGFIVFKNSDNIIQFPRVELPGIKLYEANAAITIYDETHIKGKVVSISGKDKTVNVEIMGANNDIYKCEIDDVRAQDLFWGLFISAGVTGDWIRLENGTWEVPPRKKLTIKNYQKIKMESNETIFTKLSNLISESSFNNIQDGITLDAEESQ